MPKTYAQLTREIQALQAHADKMRHSEKQDVIAKLNASIATYALRPEDLRFADSTTAARSTSRRMALAGDAKYSDGQGNVWGGRGPRPVWLRTAMAQGRSLESFATTGQGARSAANASTPAKVSLPPLYSHPKTGQTWSGRGPKPAWLKQGLKKRGASIDDFRISARASAAVSVPSDATPTLAPRKTAPVERVSTSKVANGSQAKPSGKAAAKSLAQKISKHTQGKATTQAAPTATSTSSFDAPVKKAAGGKAASGKSAPSPDATSSSSKPQPTAKKAPGGRTADAASARAASASIKAAAPAKKAETPTKALTDTGRHTAKPAAKRTAPAGKSLAASISPPPETPTPAPVASIKPAVAPVSMTASDTRSAPETHTSA